MASTTDTICGVCSALFWCDLQPEDIWATPHHKSHNALKASAESCPLCRLVLKAAVSAYRDSRGIRHGRGYWTRVTSVKYYDVDSTVRDVMYHKSFGPCLPAATSEFMSPGGGVTGPTGAPNPEMEIMDGPGGAKEIADALGEPPGDMPVWVYSNFWAEHERLRAGDMSHLRLMGFGARFATSKSHFDVFGVKENNIQLCGSSISVCTSDGEC